jgi:uncharacterized protein YceK
MTRNLFVAFAVLLLSGCCTQVQRAVSAYASAVINQTDTGSELLKRCQRGEKDACNALQGVLGSIRSSAETLRVSK